jgi:hypothetical protein
MTQDMRQAQCTEKSDEATIIPHIGVFGMYTAFDSAKLISSQYFALFWDQLWSLSKMPVMGLSADD